MSDVRNRILHFRVNDEEADYIKKKFALSGCKSESEFFRKMIMFGCVFQYDDEKQIDISRQIMGIGKNINQIARRVHITGNLYPEDIAEIKEELQKVWQQQEFIQSVLLKLKP